MATHTAAAASSEGLREAMSCDVCSEVYEQAFRIPLVLPCGHTFCRSCLIAIKKSGYFLCPKCRMNHNHIQLETLTANYSLLNILPHYDLFSQSNEKCGTHGDDLRYWCSTCELPLCSLCLYSGHPQGHTVKLVEIFVKEKKVELEKKINVIFENAVEQKRKLKYDLNNLNSQVIQLFQRNMNLQNNEDTFNDLLRQTHKANDISSIMSIEKTIKESHNNILMDFAEEGDTCETPSSKGALVSGDEKTLVTGEMEGKYAAGEVQNTKPHSEQQEQQPARTSNFSRGILSQLGYEYYPRYFIRGSYEDQSFYTQRCTTTRRHPRSHKIILPKHNQAQHEETEVPRAVIDYRDGRLLLHTLTEPLTTKLSLQVPCEVFLELGINGRCLGRVYIRLWSSLRQAQQFLALCMGTMGPSFLGTKASEKVRNMIVFRSAVDRNKSVAQALLVGLEWGGQYARTEDEGFVTGMAGNNGIAFGICTQGQTNATMNAPFGKVVAGLEAANEAFQHNPVTEVTITHCGLVLPGLSQ